MLSFVPHGLAPNAPLVVVLHGCTQTAEAHADAAGWLALASQAGFAVLAPEQRTSNNPNRCFNWFKPGDAARDQGEAASIRAMIAHMLDAHQLDAQRVFITGLSAGGAMTSAMLGSYPEVFAGGAIVAGLPFGVADNVQSAFAAMGGLGQPTEHRSVPGSRLPRVTVWHGDADHTVSVANMDQIARQWLSAHALSFERGASETLGRRVKTVWRASGSDQILVETNIVRDLGHGTPLATEGHNGLGSVAPYMLEAEISAVLEIARFWGLPIPDLYNSTEKRAKRAATNKTSHLGESIGASLAGSVPANVENVIKNALRRAGLMR
ncbi:MAG: PHB depolymerase family esterase [Phycisphaerales bacterium]|nr:PHB depolymerase family esterase [Hyphomonadaceae bacterium]